MPRSRSTTAYQGRPLIIDSFAGGGGASEGIRAAVGRDPDYALNHNPTALAMHRINHPATHHIEEDVWNVDARAMCAGRPVGLLWMSPDCKHFSKAKGGKPREKQVRGLAWVGISWIKSLPPWQRPVVVCLENVEEFQDWGPLLDSGQPCPVQKGATFRAFVAAFEAMGYAVEWRELKACDYGAPTIRKRLFLIARRDGEPIVWPAPTHGAPASPGVLAGLLKPWRTAAEIIDWSLPCPSIFDSSAEIKAKYGIRAIRPLAENTMARVAKGTWRYVVTAARPFLVQVNHGDSGGRRVYPVDAPANTMTANRGEAVVTPFITKFNRGATGHAMDQPLATVTAHASETHGGGASPLGLVSGILVPRYGERAGQEPRARPVDVPAPAIVPTGNEGSLAAIHLSAYYGPGSGGVDRSASPLAPLATDTAGGNRHALVATFLAQHNTGRDGAINPGTDARAPVSTITAAGGQQGLVAAHLLNLRGSDRRDGPIDAPAPTVSAGGNHAAAVYAFLTKYYGTGAIGQACDEPMHTLTAKDRHGVVTVTVNGDVYTIVDLGMRMLTTRERFNAQGFRSDYIIDRGELEDGTIIPLTLEQQGSCCGNSVCPDLAEAIVGANYRERDLRFRHQVEAAPMPLFAAE